MTFEKIMSNDANIEEEATFAAEKEQPITKNVSPKVGQRTVQCNCEINGTPPSIPNWTSL